MFKPLAATAAVVLGWVFLIGCNNQRNAATADRTTTGDASTDATPATRPASGVDQSEEVSRLVYERDEIVSVLRNGMVVIAKRVTSPVVSVRGYVRTGGVYEGQWLGGGLSHLLEHLVAGGTNERRSEEENKTLLQQIGNNSNAYTTADHTAYFVNTTTEHLDKAVDLVTGWMFGAKITNDEYRREYEVVQRELEKDLGEPDWVFYHLTQRNRYLVSPARVPTIGYQEVIQGLTRDDVYSYYKLAYQPNNMVFAIAGNVDPEQALRAVQKHVRAEEPGRAFGHDIAEEPPVVAPRTLVGTFPKLGQAKLELGFPTIELQHPDLYALDLLATILARGESSILVEEIRDKKQLVSAIGASSYTPQFVEGTFSIQMELDHDKISAATSAILDELDRIKKEGVSEDRLARAKTQMRTSRAFSLVRSEDVAQSMATDYLSAGDPHFSDHYVDRIQKVTAEQVKEMAVKYFDRSKLLTTAMVPAEAVEPKGLPAAVNMLRSLAPTTQKSPAEEKPTVVRVELENDVTLLLKRVPTSPIVVMNMYGLGGLTAEDAKTNGLGNLTMNTLSRGSKSRSAQQIAEFFDSIGGDFGASCGNNSWNWSAACMKEDLGKTLEVFADVVKNPSFPENELAFMKKRIAAAIESQDADWFQQSMRFFRKTYFGPGDSPYQFMSIGTKENVLKFNQADVAGWYHDRVLASRKVLAIFGDIDVEQARKLAAEQFGGESKRGSAVPASKSVNLGAANLTTETPTITVKSVVINKSNNPQTGVLIGFNAQPVVGSPRNYPLTVADTMTSGFGYPTGYIFEILRGRGLVYDANAFLFPGAKDVIPGAFVAYAGCDAKNANEVIDVILENIARLQGSPEDMQADWFDRSKQLITTADALNNETPAAQAQTAALNELFGLGYAYHDQFADKINEVTIGHVQSVARLHLNECVVTVTTNQPELITVKEGRRTYTTFPKVDLAPKGVQHDTPAGK
jgi:zinc protease